MAEFPFAFLSDMGFVGGKMKGFLERLETEIVVGDGGTGSQ